MSLKQKEDFDESMIKLLTGIEEDIWIIIKNNDDDICRSKYPSEYILKLIQEYFKELKNES